MILSISGEEPQQQLDIAETRTGQYFLSLLIITAGWWHDVLMMLRHLIICELSIIWVLASVTRISSDNTRPGWGPARRFNYSYQPDFLRVIEKYLKFYFSDKNDGKIKYYCNTGICRDCQF